MAKGSYRGGPIDGLACRATGIYRMPDGGKCTIGTTTARIYVRQYFDYLRVAARVDSLA